MYACVYSIDYKQKIGTVRCSFAKNWDYLGSTSFEKITWDDLFLTLLRASMAISSFMIGKKYNTRFQAQLKKVVDRKIVRFLKVDFPYDKFLGIKVGEFVKAEYTDILVLRPVRLEYK